MQTAEQILQAMQKLGEKRLPLTRIYRCLYNENLYLAAYGKLYRNQGALTPGTDEKDTADGMSLERIHNLIDAIRSERFKFKPLRRAYLKKKSGGKRPLGLPTFSDKLVQEVLRMILQAYYEPQFCDSTHGYRPERGCHTALAQLSEKFQGASWFIEGDIRGCFDNIDHDTLMHILSKRIHDGRILNLIRQGLEAGVMEEWHYQRTYSGTPQGGVLSPLLSNIYLHELDTFVEQVLIPQHSYGKKRRGNPDYIRLSEQIRKARESGELETTKRLERERRKIPSVDTNDSNFRRLRYVRYADDFILGFIGPKSEAEAIKTAIAEFLRNELHLELSPTKTLITHARTQHARFLSYAISTFHADDKLSNRPNTPAKMRSINGGIRLGIPYGLVDEYTKPYMRRGKPVHEAGLLMCSDAHIIDAYQSKYRGVAIYYKFAVDRDQLSKLRYVMETSLAKTLASKFKITVSQVYRKYRGTQNVDGRAYPTLQVEVPTKRATRIVYWGAIPLKVVKTGREPLNDARYREQWTNLRSDLVKRLQADTCELCGVDMKCEVHHVKKLADLKKRWNGRKGKPEWVKRMIAMERKTLIVCEECHEDIHAGRPIPNSRT